MGDFLRMSQWAITIDTASDIIDSGPCPHHQSCCSCRLHIVKGTKGTPEYDVWLCWSNNLEESFGYRTQSKDQTLAFSCCGGGIVECVGRKRREGKVDCGYGGDDGQIRNQGLRLSRS